MTISALPAAPSRSSPSDFSTKADAFVAALPTFVTEANALATAMNLNDTTATSTDSVAIATGAKSFTVDISKSFQVGMAVMIAYDSTNWMHGSVTSYNSGTGALVVNVTNIGGSGTKATWTVTLSAPVNAMTASTAAAGVIEIATNAEALALADTARALTADDLAYVLNTLKAHRWKQTTGTFTATPASTSTLTMTSDLTGSIKAGMSLWYVIGGVNKYGRVNAITSILLTIDGAPLSGDVTALYYDGGIVRQMTVQIPGTYEDASNTALIASDLKSSLIWNLPVSYCVKFRVYSFTHDSGTHGQASVRINNTELCTTAGGLTIAADTTWYATVVDIDAAAYDINPGEAIEITSVKAGTGDATYLTVEMILVTP